MMRRIFSIFLAVVLLLSFVGCEQITSDSTASDPEQSETVQKNSTIQLLYCLSDSFNPYQAVTGINRELCGLLYDPLIKLDNNFEPIYALARSAVIDGTKCTVTLRDALFTDGSPVTADDVVYSYNLAKASTTKYADHLYEAASVSAADVRTVVFTMARHDPFFVSLLDFPILKAESEKRTDADGVVQPPIGTGRYVIADSLETLNRNDGYYGQKGTVSSIHLINAPDQESVSHYVEIGATDIYFTDVSDGKIVRMSGKKIDINLNDLVYIGINESNDALRKSEMRYAISSALDRESICQTAYYNNATAATGFFHPDFKPTKSLQNIKKSGDLKIAIENLEKIGYNRLDSNGFRINSAGIRARFSLLVNSDNTSRVAAAEKIAAQLKEVGIELVIVKKNYAEYIQSLQNGDFQLYLGEIRLTANMDLSALLLPGGSAAFGRTPHEPDKDKGSAQTGNTADTAQTEDKTGEAAEGEAEQPVPATAAEIIAGYYEGRYSITDVSSVLLTELPAIPVCYRMGLLFYDPSSADLSSASQSDIYFSNEIGQMPG